MDEKPLLMPAAPVATSVIATVYSCTAARLASTHDVASRSADGAESELGGMNWIDDRCFAYRKDACARAWGHVRKEALAHALWISSVDC